MSQQQQRDFVKSVAQKMQEFERENRQLLGQIDEAARTQVQLWNQLDETHRQVDLQQQANDRLTKERDQAIAREHELQNQLAQQVMALNQATATENALRSQLENSDRILRRTQDLVTDLQNRKQETDDELAQRAEQIARLTQQLAREPIALPPPPASPQQLAREPLALPPPPASPQPDATAATAAYEHEIANLRTEIEMAEFTTASLNDALDKKTQEVQDLQGMFEDLQLYQKQDKASHLEELKQLRAEYEAKRKNDEAQQAQWKQAYDDHLKRAQDNHAQAIQTLEDEHAKAIQILEERVQAMEREKVLIELQSQLHAYAQLGSEEQHAQAIQTREDEHAKAIQILEERVQAMEREQVLIELQSQLHAYAQQGSEEQRLCDLESAYNAQQGQFEEANADLEQAALGADQDEVMARSWQRCVTKLQTRQENDTCLIAFKLVHELRFMKSRRRLLELEDALTVSNDQLAVCRQDLQSNEDTLWLCNDALNKVSWAFMGPFLYRVGSTDNVKLDEGFVNKMFASPYRDFFDVVLKTYDDADSTDQLEFMDQLWKNFEKELQSNAAAATDPRDPTVVVLRLMAMVETFAQKD